LRVPARDGQLILGHSRLPATLEICSHEDKQTQRDALGKIRPKRPLTIFKNAREVSLVLDRAPPDRDLEVLRASRDSGTPLAEDHSH
jgi:hypothetical protein